MLETLTYYLILFFENDTTWYVCCPSSRETLEFVFHVLLSLLRMRAALPLRSRRNLRSNAWVVTQPRRSSAAQAPQRDDHPRIDDGTPERFPVHDSTCTVEKVAAFVFFLPALFLVSRRTPRAAEAAAADRRDTRLHDDCTAHDALANRTHRSVAREKNKTI